MKPKPFGDICGDCTVELVNGCADCILTQLAKSILDEVGVARDTLLQARQQFRELVAESYEVYEELERNL